MKFAEQAVEITTPEDPLRGRYTAELCELLSIRATWTGSVEDADTAVELARKALLGGGAAVPGIRGTLRRALINSLATNYELTGKEEYVNDALKEFGLALNALDSPSALRQFAELKKGYQNAGETGILLPREDESDPFQPFFDCLVSLKEEYLTDLQKFMQLWYDPDLMEQETSLDLILGCIILYYRHHGRLDLTLRHGLEVLTFANSAVEWFKKLIPNSEDIEQWESYLEYMATRAELNITLGDTLYAMGREEEARGKYDMAVRDLRIGKENIYRTLTKCCLKPGIWMFEGSRFVEEYFKLEKVVIEEEGKGLREGHHVGSE